MSVLAIWWCPCVESSRVVGRGCLLWPVCSLGKTLLAFVLFHSLLQGQICLLLQVFLDILLLHSSSLQWKGHLFWVLVLKDLVGLHITVQLQFNWKRSVFIPIPKKSNAKECSNYHTIALISHASKVMLKILQARLQQYMNHELPDVQPGFRKDRGTRDQIANIRWIMEKTREFQKNIYFCFIDYAKAFDCVDHKKLWKILQEMGISDHPTCLLKTCIQVRKQQLELDMEQQTGSK